MNLAGNNPAHICSELFKIRKKEAIQTKNRATHLSWSIDFICS